MATCSSTGAEIGPPYKFGFSIAAPSIMGRLEQLKNDLKQVITKMTLLEDVTAFEIRSAVAEAFAELSQASRKSETSLPKTSEPGRERSLPWHSRPGLVSTRSIFVDRAGRVHELIQPA